MGEDRIRVAAVAALLTLALAGSALAGPPSEQLQPSIDKVLRILADSRLQGAGHSGERRRAIREVVDDIFDWTEMARRSLGRHWQARTVAEREEFVQLFRDVLERSYISTIERYSGEKIVYRGDAVEDAHATVHTTFVTREGKEVPLDYRMIHRDGRWFVYDVLVEHVGIVSNYRTQFNRIIQTSSYEALLRKMRRDDAARKAS